MFFFVIDVSTFVMAMMVVIVMTHVHMCTLTHAGIFVLKQLSHPEAVLQTDKIMAAAAATPQQQLHRSQPRVSIWDFYDWLGPDGRLDVEKCTTPEHARVILQQWRMPPYALPGHLAAMAHASMQLLEMEWRDIENLCYSVKKEGQEHEIWVLLARQAFMTQGPGMDICFFSFWHRPDFEFDYIKKPHTLLANPSCRGWNHPQIHDAWQEAKCLAGWEPGHLVKSGLLKPIQQWTRFRLDHYEGFEVAKCIAV